MNSHDMVIKEFEKYCDSMKERCPKICVDALGLLKAQGKEIKQLKDELAKLKKKTPKQPKQTKTTGSSPTNK